MAPLFIRDGYTADGFLPPRPPWPALHFRYRPALSEDVFEYQHQTRQASGRMQMKAVIELLQKHLIGWDATDEKGELVPVTPENLRRLPPPLVYRLIDIVTGYGEQEQENDVKN